MQEPNLPSRDDWATNKFTHRVPERWRESKKDMEGAIVVESQRRMSRKIKKVRMKEELRRTKQLHTYCEVDR